MGADTKIEWCDDTLNPWWGCEKISPGCKNCYADDQAKRYGHEVWGAKAPRRFFGDAHWNEPLKWNRLALESGRRRRVFCASFADVFEDRRDLDVHRARLWKLIEATPHLDWLLLTKRPENHEMVPLAWQTGSRRPPNVWLGTTTEDQDHLEKRAPHVLAARWPAVRFLSAEPLLEGLDLGRWMQGSGTRIDWVIVGGESGAGSRPRPFQVEWARSIIRQCRTAGAAPFIKQLGARPFYEDGLGLHPLHLVSRRKGKDVDEWPEDLRVREFPKAAP